MEDIFNDDDFFKSLNLGADGLGGEDDVTVPIGSASVKSSPKLLVVLFIIDCSSSMAGDRIVSVNNALRELKYVLLEKKKDEPNLDLRVGILTFSSYVNWDVDLVPIDEYVFEDINTRPGLTQYGVVFHELNRVLNKSHIYNFNGKKAPAAIIFLTDGEPSDDYEYDLDELRKNKWFTNSNRSAILIGEAIDNDKAREAVCKFVEDPDKDIKAIDDTADIIRELKIKTLHTIAGSPSGNDSTPIDNTQIENKNLDSDSPMDTQEPENDDLDSVFPIGTPEIEQKDVNSVSSTDISEIDKNSTLQDTQVNNPDTVDEVEWDDLGGFGDDISEDISVDEKTSNDSYISEPSDDSLEDIPSNTPVSSTTADLPSFPKFAADEPNPINKDDDDDFKEDVSTSKDTFDSDNDIFGSDDDFFSDDSGLF